MINDNALSNKLNDFKNNKSLSENSAPSTLNDSILNISNTIVSLLILLGKGIIYGYSFKIIFTTDWNFISTFSIGLGFLLILEYIFDLFHK